MIGAKRLRYESREPVDEKPGPPSIATIVPSDFAVASVRGWSSNADLDLIAVRVARSSGTSIEPHHAPVMSVHGSSVTVPSVIGCVGIERRRPRCGRSVALEAGVGDVTTGMSFSSMTLLHPATMSADERDDRDRSHGEDGTCAQVVARFAP